MTRPRGGLTRRGALTGSGGLLIALMLPGSPGRLTAQVPAPGARPFQPDAYVQVGTDDTVLVLVKHIEMGQGPLTGLATMVAEELDADWAHVRAVHAPADVTLYGGPRGIQLTAGSSAMATSWDLMRRAGATARAMLVEAAAAAWGVDPATVAVAAGVLSHPPSGRTARFGEFAAAAAHVAVPAEVRLKEPGQYRLIGRTPALPRLDLADKTNGRARYAIDLHEAGMLTVVVARPPRFGATLAHCDDRAALKVRGVVAVKPVPSGVAVYARNTWAALKGRRSLTLSWDESTAEPRGTDEIIAEYRALATTRGTVAGAVGDAATLPGAPTGGDGTVIEAEYILPHLAHAPMEPLTGAMQWNATSVRARYGCQLHTFDQQAIAQVFGLSPGQVAIETTLAGGSFGRRGTADSHFAVELSHVARAIGPNIPVKLMWTREDDIGGGYYRPLFLHRIRGRIESGRITAIADTVVGQSFVVGSPLERMVLSRGPDPTALEGISQLFYDVPAYQCDYHFPPIKVPGSYWRSVAQSQTVYVRETFLDRLLTEAGQDPIGGRLALLARQPRLARVLREVAASAGWGTRRLAPGRALGVAIAEVFRTPVAQVAEVSLDDNAEPRVHALWCVVDCGVAINPDVIRAQVEGGVGFALGHALFADVPLHRGAAAVSNFDGYRALRIGEMPHVEVTIISSDSPPTGIGEPPVPCVGPAVANALARLGHERPLRLPFVRAA